MELQAPIEALEALLRGQAPVDVGAYRKIVFWTDSMYVVDNIYNARYVWPARRWMTADRNPVRNVEQWKRLVKLIKKVGRRVDFNWVKGHKTSTNNKGVDKLAKASAKAQTGRRLGPPVTVRRKLSQEPTDRGSVPMHGQLETIRIVTSSLTPQGLNEYRYEIVSAGSADYGKVDFAFSERDLVLRAGHSYEIRFGTEQKTPRIVELLGELEKDASSDGDQERDLS